MQTRQTGAADDKIIRRFDLVIQSGRELSSTFDPDVIFERLYKIVSSAMDCASFMVSTYSSVDDLIRCAHVRLDGTLLDPSVYPPIPLQRDNPHATQSLAIITGKSLLINDFVAHTSGKTVVYYVDTSNQVYDEPSEGEEYTQSVLITPMILDDQVIGVFQTQSYRLNAYTEDDLRFLEALAPQIAIVLQNAVLHQRLQAHAAALEQRVEQRTEELRQALEQANELARLKSRFISMITHEFRNPLAAIQTSVDIVDRYAPRLTAESRDQHFQKIQVNIDHLKELMEQVLFISRSESMAVQAHLSPASPEKLCREIVGDLQLICPTHRLIFTMSGTDRLLMLDPKLIQQAVSNLITNAVKYSPDSDLVEIALRIEGDLRITVKDTGIGIPEADLPHLFDTFYRGSNVGEISGTGLGLVVAKVAVEAHGGSLHVESHSGAGTTFTIMLPFPSPINLS